MSELEEAERLFKLATPGEWKAMLEWQAYGHVEPPENEPGRFAIVESLEDDPPLAVFAYGPEEANARSVAALHNAAPALFAAVRENKALRAIAEKFLALEDNEAHIEEAYERLLPELRAALSTKAK